MKTHLLGFVGSALVAAAAVADSYTVTAVPGYTAIANHLDRGGNTLNEVLPTVPDGSQFIKYDCAIADWWIYTYYVLSGWVPNDAAAPPATFSPGEGGFFFNPTPVAILLTFEGSPRSPVLPNLPCGLGLNFISRQTVGIGTFENITGQTPTKGSVWLQWDPAMQWWTTNVYTFAGWIAGEPTAQVGESVIIRYKPESPEPSNYKWNQPPVPTSPTNVFYGWNEISVTNQPPVAADDWVCTTPGPVTKIRWWGSFAGWSSFEIPPFLPNAFQITIWTDTPANPGQPGSFSHPDVAIWQTQCQNFTMTFAGWDYDPRTKQYEACFLYEQTLLPHEWFYQEPGPTGTNIYWISIAAEYGQGTMGPWPWGWKTRPRDSNSPAPDDAVRIHAPLPWMITPGVQFQAGDPIFWPAETNSWDLAFELFSGSEGLTHKWCQVPDLSTQGMDVHATWNPGAPPPFLLADDFLCTSPGPITNITIWGSWLNDQVWPNVTFTLSIHDDIPTNQSPTGYSMPGEVRWQRSFTPGEYGQVEYAQPLDEWWFTPPDQAFFPGDHVCYQYNFNIPPLEAFPQEGTPANPRVYWLDVQAQLQGAAVPPEYLFGWKTCPTNWNDDAVWVKELEPYNGVWQRLTYPPMHPRAEQTVDLAFRLNQSPAQVQEIKWSQPPVLYTANMFSGWNEPSVFESAQIVADDWVCTNVNPVTDIHWWGSFLNWSETTPPVLPDLFHITIWTDVPAVPGQPQSFSHPGEVLRVIPCSDFNWEFAGYDIDPRDPMARPEACFKFEQLLHPEEWFYQNENQQTNIYWISIAAVYPSGQVIEFPWGWKTRPRDTHSLAPDDAVRIFVPTAPMPGMTYEAGDPIWWPYSSNSWDMAFALTTQQTEPPTADFGDAPDSAAAPGYPTLLANNGAQHTVVPNVFLGVAIDAEADGQPNLIATGDDLNNLADEDGVVFNSRLVPGESATITVTASINGMLDAWIDFGANTSWADAGDQVFTNQALVAGVNTLNFVVPTNAAGGNNTFARFRFSTGGGLGFAGPAADGEVEDYQVYLEELDFGDAPDPSYPTSRASNGARHVVLRAMTLGALIDSETDGQPNANATGDDLANQPDEDGVTLLTPLLPGQSAQVRVIASIPNGILNAWVDFNLDGSWATGGDQIVTNAVLAAGVNVLNFNVPLSAVAGTQVKTRFRFSTMPNLSFMGLAPDGEVEDYSWRVDAADFGDAPDPTFPTLLANTGAQHVVGNLRLGTLVDAEADGQPNASATGDDVSGVADEDGVFFPTALIANAPATIQVVSSGAGWLQGWFDFDADGTWTNVSEHPINNRPVVAGTNLVQIFVPNAVPGRSYARFRLSTVTNLTFTGLAPDGEVEDYAITFHPLKWNQTPEQGPEGVDVYDGVPLADDFLCTQSGPITDIHIWGSFRHDLLPVGGPGNMNITLTIYKDIPAGSGPSQPGAVLWTRTFGPGQFAAGLCMRNASEWYHDPQSPSVWQPNADQNIWQFDFYLSPTNAFPQISNTVYWLGVQYSAVPADTNYTFGWKTTYRQWNDAACWFDATSGNWLPLLYGDGHPRADDPPPFNRMDLAFALSTEDLDWGDAPDSVAAPTYPTLAANNGASHVIVAGLKLGNLIDAEPDGQPNAIATGDDVVNLPDEDGVLFNLPLIPGQSANVTVTASAPGLLDAWVDFAGDGSWAEAGDQIFTNLPLSAGPNALTFLVASNAPWGATTFARFRFSSAGNLAFTGLAPDGEVEDYALPIHPLPQADLGDAPDGSNHAGANMTAYPAGGPPGIKANYPTVYGGPLAAPPFGPMHLNATTAFLGAAVSGEVEADLGADQDFVNNLLPVADQPDLDSADDGLIGVAVLPHCGNGLLNVQVTVLAPPPGPLFLNVWCDWNRDGDWSDVLLCPDGSLAAEWAVANLPVPPLGGLMPLPVKSWHPSLTKQPIWMRISLAEQQWPAPGGGLVGGDGPALGYQFGETEDYYLTDYDDAQSFDWGDAPDSPYPTLLASSGAQHLIVPNFHLGNLIDTEPDGQPDPYATGDDLAGSGNDEDGVKFVTPILVATQACVDVFLTGPVGGKLDGWLDFNRSGLWESGEQIFAGRLLSAGLNAGLCFNVPTNAVLGTNFARFRLSSAGGLLPTGAAQEGEVEDYQVLIQQPKLGTNIVITWIGVTNLNLTNQVVTVKWNAETNAHYQLQATTVLSNAASLVWSNVGPTVIGPANEQRETNAWTFQRYYRVIAPYVAP